MSCTITLPAVQISQNMQNLNLTASLSRTDSKSYYNAAPMAAEPALPPAYAPLVPAPAPVPALSEDDELLTKLPAPRFKVTPRDEEGHEPLPEYETSIFKTAIFDFKTEMETPFVRSKDRSWHSAYIALNGTQLEIYKPKRSNFMGNTFVPGVSADSTCGYEPGTPIAKYTLQGAEVGVAADYLKRHFVIRLRVEAAQILLSMRSVVRMLEWTEALAAAIDIAPSLEDRSLPKYQTIPRRRRTPQQVMQEQEEIIRRHFPQLLEGADSTNSNRPHEDDVDVEAFRAVQPVSAPASVRNLDARIPEAPRNSSASLSSPTTEMSRCRSSSSSVYSQASSSSDSDAKWAPPRTITEHSNLMFARRCLAVLPAAAPRRSDYIVSGGKRWKINWDAKCLQELKDGELLPPPEYSEEEESEGLA